MRIAVINQRLSLIQGPGAVDVHAASGGRFGDITLPPGGHTDWEVELSTADSGRQLRILPAPTRRLLALRVGADDADDLTRAAANLTRLGVPQELRGTPPPPSFLHPEDLAAMMTGAHSAR
jgi:hypothetical protein